MISKEYSATLNIIVNDKKIELPKFASVNGTLQSGYYEIQENDEIEMLNYYTVEQIVEFMDVSIDSEMNLYVNNKWADINTKVFENFSVMWGMEKLSFEEDMRALSENVSEDLVYEEDDYQENPIENNSVTMSVVVNGKQIHMHGKQSYVFVDVFDYVDFDLSKVKGSGIVTTCNGTAAQYMEPLEQGDVIEIYWKDSE